MKLIKLEELSRFDEEEYIWYACYGSNINYDRFMYYINGDTNGKYSTTNGCRDKTRPLEERKFIFKHPIYFAGTSKVWGGGIAILDYQLKGKTYGKIYKIKMNQFKGILAQELRCKLYDTIVIVDYIDKLPVFTFTSKNRLNDQLNQPSNSYIKVIKKGLLDLYDDMDSNQVEQYLKN